MELEVWESARNATYKAVAFLNMVTAQVRSLENSSHTQTAHRKNKWRLAEESAKLASATAVKAERDAESKLNDVAGEAFKAWKEMEDAYKTHFTRIKQASLNDMPTNADASART